MQDLCSIDIGWYHHQMLVLNENRKPLVSSLRTRVQDMNTLSP